jgi:hypothetical protein
MLNENEAGKKFLHIGKADGIQLNYTRNSKLSNGLIASLWKLYHDSRSRQLKTIIIFLASTIGLTGTVTSQCLLVIFSLLMVSFHFNWIVLITFLKIQGYKIR